MPTPARVLRRAAALIVCATTLSACGLLPGTSGDETPALERNTLRIGVLPVVDVAPLKLALNDKLFERAGLQVQLVDVSSEDEGLKQLDSTLDITWGSHVKLFSKVAEGTELQIQGEAYQAGANSMALVTTNPQYDSAEKIKGRSANRKPKIAVDSTKDLGALTTTSVLKTAGIEQSSVELTTMPFSQMVNDLRADKIQAAWMIEPYITKAQREVGARVITDTATGPTQDFPMSGYASSKKFADANPQTLKLFRSVLQEAQQAASDNKLAVQDVLTSYIDVDQQTAALVSIGTFPVSLNSVRLQRVADMMDTADVLVGKLDVQVLLPEGTASTG
ncbi:MULTISPECIES: ABC transporter substrate-binding protein [Actinosynnema]|uniref:Nitrate ABC transporter substrate-binding protein n=1 Tax=Actinosynnema pretiosum TaxID=42197 RepID=A0A290YZU4_9PSEU|nr:ABC transporter substrate-binding protein [Actinosynnema pretiosum]ATE52274.1 nitrate ABC transporter substrate-binding protein [Actinosynnema pretiosum]